jgi:hypothetical protein
MEGGRAPRRDGKQVARGGYEAAPPGMGAQVSIASSLETTGRAWNARILNTEDQGALFFVHAICVEAHCE